MTLVASIDVRDRLGAALVERFWEASDGYWYPIQKGEPLVRIRVTGDSYAIYRRRSPRTEWMKLVDQLVSDFDPLTFSRWANAWELTAEARA